MKVMSLNIWAGKKFDSLIKYLYKKSEEIDIFCFQEVFDTPSDETSVTLVGDKGYRANVFSELKSRLENYCGSFAVAQDDFSFDEKVKIPLSWGIAMFVKRGLGVVEMNDFFIRGHRNSKVTEKDTMPRNLQYAVLSYNGEDVLVSHFHGLWNGKGKGDTDERIEQSLRVKSFLDSRKDLGKILFGDFNLEPDTESLKILEEGNVNLIKKYGIDSTRSSLYRKYNTGSRFADYAIVSPEIKVKSFEVPDVKVSDHLPLILEI